MKVKTSVYTDDDGYHTREVDLDDAVKDLIDKTPDGYALSKLVEILAEKNVLNQSDLSKFFSYIDVDIEIPIPTFPFL